MSLAVANVPFPVVLDQGLREGLVVAGDHGLEQPVDLGAHQNVRETRLPGNERRVDCGAQDNSGRFGVGEYVELGGGRYVAATVDRAAHDDEPPDAAGDAGRAPP